MSKFITSIDRLTVGYGLANVASARDSALVVGHLNHLPCALPNNSTEPDVRCRLDGPDQEISPSKFLKEFTLHIADSLGLRTVPIKANCAQHR